MYSFLLIALYRPSPTNLKSVQHGFSHHKILSPWYFYQLTYRSLSLISSSSWLFPSSRLVLCTSWLTIIPSDGTPVIFPDDFVISKHYLSNTINCYVFDLHSSKYLSFIQPQTLSSMIILQTLSLTVAVTHQ